MLKKLVSRLKTEAITETCFDEVQEKVIFLFFSFLKNILLNIDFILEILCKQQLLLSIIDE